MSTRTGIIIGIALLALIAFLAIGWHNAEVDSVTQAHALQHQIDSIKAIEQVHVSRMDSAGALAQHWKALADSLSNAHTPSTPVPVGIAPNARRERILAGTAVPL